MKLQCELYPSRHVALCLDPYCGLGFALWCLSSVYSGHHTILIPPSEVELNPAVWLTAVSQYKVRDTFCSYGELKEVSTFKAPSCSKITFQLLRCDGAVHQGPGKLCAAAEGALRRPVLHPDVCGGSG